MTIPEIAKAFVTMRAIDGEPVHYDDPVVMVGSIDDLYFPTCSNCHIVLPSRK